MNTTPFPISQLSGLREIRQQGVPTLQQVLENIDMLYQGACEARVHIEEGYNSPLKRNWRGMLVGADAWVKLQNGEYILVTGYNTKRTPAPNDPSRRCAEERIMAELYRIDQETPIEYVVALVVVGDFQFDDTSGKECTTLHPCGNCRRKLVLDQYMRDLTLIITAQPPNEQGQPPYAEIHTRQGLIGFHQPGGKS